jgi:hypothetical protein
MAGNVRLKWSSPEVRRYGTFEAATHSCGKTLGTADGLLLSGSPLTCSSGS